MVQRAWDKYLNVFGNILIAVGSFAVRDPKLKLLNRRLLSVDKKLFDPYCSDSLLVSKLKLFFFSMVLASVQQ